MLDSTKLLNQLLRMINTETFNVKKEINVSPVSEIRETVDEIIVTMEVPGIQSREDIGFSITTTKAYVKGVRQKLNDGLHASSDSGKARQEFAKSFTFPFPVRPETASATYSKGILELKIKKMPEKVWDQVFVHFLQ